MPRLLHTLTTHCRSGPPRPAQLCVVFLYLQIHSLTHVCLRTPGLLELALLGLGPGLELATQLACTPPLQLGTRLLRVALVSHSLSPSAACVGYV